LIHFYKRSENCLSLLTLKTIHSTYKMGLMPWEKTTTCPYEPSHQITIERIQSHLVKCRRNHPNSNHVICPFNASHHIPQPEERFHLANCPDRRIVELDKYSWAVEDSQHGYLKLPPESSSNRIHDLEVEDWERDIRGSRVKSYDPQEKCEKTGVIRKLQGATRSERKKFSVAERIRHEQLPELDESRDEDNGDFHSPRPTLLRQERHSLRRPTVTDTDNFYSPRPTLLRDEIQQEGAVKNTLSSARHGITSRLLTMVGKKLEPEVLPSPNDTLDSQMGKLVLGNRKPSGVEK